MHNDCMEYMSEINVSKRMGSYFENAHTVIYSPPLTTLSNDISSRLSSNFEADASNY